MFKSLDNLLWQYEDAGPVNQEAIKNRLNQLEPSCKGKITRCPRFNYALIMKGLTFFCTKSTRNERNPEISYW